MDPLFERQATRDYRLGSVSPCINAGTNETWMDSALDLALQKRRIEHAVDMGAYEAPAERGTIFVFL